MYKKRLFEKIIDLNKSQDYQCSEIEAKDSIIKYLNQILSIRRGSCIINKDFGINDIFDLYSSSFNHFMQKAQDEVKTAISNYEPRLKDIIFEFNDKNEENLYYNFKIKGHLISDYNTKINLNSTINLNGNINISKN